MKDGILSDPTNTKETFYILQWTWGIIMNIIGSFIFLYALIAKWEIKKYRNAIALYCPKRFGAINFGMFLVIGKGNEKSLPHEYGHGIQNLIWGPLMPFVISIPSAIRFWYRKIKYTNKGKKCPTSYYSIWFEAQANEFGARAEADEWSWL